MTVVSTKPTRKQRFRAALELAGMTMDGFAEQAGVTRVHLSLVLAGKRESNRLTEAMDDFAEKQLKRA